MNINYANMDNIQFMEVLKVMWIRNLNISLMDKINSKAEFRNLRNPRGGGVVLDGVKLYHAFYWIWCIEGSMSWGLNIITVIVNSPDFIIYFHLFPCSKPFPSPHCLQLYIGNFIMTRSGTVSKSIVREEKRQQSFSFPRILDLCEQYFGFYSFFWHI